MTLSEALQVLETTDPHEVTPDQLAYLLESLEFWLTEREFCFEQKRTICRMSQSIRAELEAAERRYLPVAGDTGERDDAAYMMRRDEQP